MTERVVATTPARIGLLGNPSDGYFGACISLPIYNWQATVTLTKLERPRERGEKPYTLPDNRGLVRIMEATINVFTTHFARPPRDFHAQVETTIPRQVGLSGSSAIETAFMRAMMEWEGISPDELPPRQLAELVLKVETDELGMVAGLQDRLPQAFLQMLFMDFDKSLMTTRGYGEYTALSTESIPKLWVAHAPRGEDSGVTHSQIAQRWEEQDEGMIEIINHLRDCAERGRGALESGNSLELASLIDTNFDLRRELFGDEALGATLDAVKLARSLGSCAKQCGSGGSIFGIIPNGEFAAIAPHAFSEMGWTYLGDIEVSR